MANLASLFAMPLTLVTEDVEENQKSRQHQAKTQPEASQKASNSENGCAKPAEVDVPSATGEIKLNNDQREVGGNKTSPKKKKKKKQNKRTQVHKPTYIDYDKKTVEEAKLLDSSQWMWNDTTASAASNHESEPASASNRSIVSYEELMRTGIFRKNARWKGRSDPARQEKPDINCTSSSANVLQSMPPSTKVCSSPSNIESVARTDAGPFSVDSSNLSSADSEKKVHCYIDYDKRLVDDTELHDPFVRRLTDVATSAASNHGNGSKSLPSFCQPRDIVSYEELSRPKHPNNRSRDARGRGQNFQLGPCIPNGGAPARAFRGPSDFNCGPPNKVPRLAGAEFVVRNNIPTMRPVLPCSFIDPNVAATEKEEIFEKPQPPVVNSTARKPLSNKQRKKIEKAKFYKEKLRQQQEKEKDRIVVQKTLQCRFFSYGSCTKGDECPFSHDFVPQKRPELCKFYVMSFCEKGANCVYYHKDWPCKFFHVFRSCTQGDACRFSHEPLTDETRPLLDKVQSQNEGIPNCGPAVKPSESGQPPTNGHSLPPTATINDTQRIVGENAFCSAENFRQTANFAGQMPPGTNDLGSDPIQQEPWNKKLEPIDLNETHRPRLPSGVESSNPMFLQDPRVERYGVVDRPVVGSVIRDDALGLCEPVAIEFDCDSYRYSKFLASASELKSMHGSFVSNGTKTLSGDDNDVFPSARGMLTGVDSTAKSKEAFSSSCLLSSGLSNGQSDGLKLKTARHFSLPLTRHSARGNGVARLARNGVTGMVATSSGPTNHSLPQPHN